MNHDGELRLKTDRKLSAGYILKRNIKYIKPEIVNLIFSMILMVVSVVLGLLLPNIIKEIVNGLQAKGVINYYKILNYAIVYFLIGLISQATRFIQTMILQHAGQRIVYDMRTEVFTHIENMSQNQFNEMPVGSLVTRVASYTANMSDLFTNTIVNVLRNLITVVGVYVFMYFISVELSLIMLIFVVVIFVTSLIFSRIAKRLFRQERAYLSDLNTFLNENLSGMKLIQIFNQEERKENEFKEIDKDLEKMRYYGRGPRENYIDRKINKKDVKPILSYDPAIQAEMEQSEEAAK